MCVCVCVTLYFFVYISSLFFHLFACLEWATPSKGGYKTVNYGGIVVVEATADLPWIPSFILRWPLFRQPYCALSLCSALVFGFMVTFVGKEQPPYTVPLAKMLVMVLCFRCREEKSLMKKVSSMVYWMNETVVKPFVCSSAETANYVLAMEWLI